MPLIPTARLANVANDVLTAVVDAFAAANVALPSRRYVHTGAVAHDCEQLVVSTMRNYRGEPLQEAPGRSRGPYEPRSVEVDVALIRCVSVPNEVGDPPSAATLDGEGEARHADLWIITHGLYLAHKNGELETCQQLAIGDAEAVGPDGGFAGWTVTAHLQVQ